MFEQIWEFIMSLVAVVLSWFGIDMGKKVVVEEAKDAPRPQQHGDVELSQQLP